MTAVLTAEEMRLLDRYTIDEIGVPGPVLMETAGRGVFRHLWDAYADRARSGHTVVVCGPGNNGGDGFVVARCLANRGCRVTVVLVAARDRVRGDAAVHLDAYTAAGGPVIDATPDGGAAAAGVVTGADLLVDAVLGTGLAREVRGRPAEAVAWINGADAPVVAVDLPSGICSDTGRVLGAAVRASLTVTFAFPKRGHLLYPGAAHVGRLEVEEIGIPPAALDRVSPGLYVWQEPDDDERLVRPPDAHKGLLGHVWVVGGSPGKTGAPGLAAVGALRAGAGLATVVCPAGLDPAPRLPLEVMTVPVGGDSDWDEAQWAEVSGLLLGADAIVVGPGMGTSRGATAFLDRLFRDGRCPLVLDADALNILARQPALWRSGCPAVLTPHPGEAARILGTTPREVQADRPGVVAELARRFGAVVVLKGAGTLVSGPDGPAWIVGGPEPGLATAGTGDVLAGVVGALAARGLPMLDAARLGVHLHATAGADAARRVGADGMTASDLVAALPGAFQAFLDRTAPPA